MKDFHHVFTQFKQECPDLYKAYERLGQEVHQKSGPLDEKTRWLIKVAISGASGHQRALETHIRKAKAAGVTRAEIKQALLLMIQTVGFPAFMEAYSVLIQLERESGA